MKEGQLQHPLEEALHEEKERLSTVSVPDDIDLYIRSGIQQAKQRQFHRRRMAWVRWGSGIAACLAFVGLLCSIRLSPAIAAYVSHLPGMEKLVELISDDRGLQLAAEHDLVQPIGAVATHGDVSFSVDQVLMDQKRMLMFYTIRHKQDGHRVELEKVSFYTVDGAEWKAGYSWSGSSQREASIEQNRLDIFLNDETDIPDSLTAKVTLSVDGIQLDTPFAVTFPINKTKFDSLKEIVYPVGQSVTVDGQRFTVSKIVVYPTQTEVTIQFDPANTKHVFGFDRLRLVDEKGRTYQFWGNGIPSRPDGENGVVYNLESCYFADPQRLFLKAEGIRALDKDKLDVQIDAAKGTLSKAPDSRLKLVAIRQNSDAVGMDFSLEVEKQDEKRFISLTSELTDDRGNSYQNVSGSSHSGDSQDDVSPVQYYGELFKRTTDKGTPGQYSFTLNDYPTRLSSGFTVPIK